MTEPIITGLFALFIAVGGGSLTYAVSLDKRIDALEVKMAETYATKHDMERLADKHEAQINELFHSQKSS